MQWFNLFELFAGERLLGPWANVLKAQLKEVIEDKPHGDMPKWQAALDALPEVEAGCSFDQDLIEVGVDVELSAAQNLEVTDSLKAFHPWRKGPFQFFNQEIDTEWRSDWKWKRIKDHLSPLKNRTVLDVGCGSGYHCWRMYGAGAKLVVGIDPGRLALMQFQCVKKYQPDAPVVLLPLRMENVPAQLQAFDTVFSLGVLYHRRSPLDHILELKGSLRSGGELVLETLVVEGDEHHVLMPEDRYAVMSNVFFIPSSKMLIRWLERCGFVDVKLVDETVTTIEEQRSTEWMEFMSLKDFLDPNDSSLTKEGYPAPLRATIVARKK